MYFDIEINEMDEYVNMLAVLKSINLGSLITEKEKVELEGAYLILTDLHSQYVNNLKGDSNFRNY